MTAVEVEQVKATYSTLRSMVLQLTPGDSKCRLYCRGTTCKYCNIFQGASAIPRLYSTWITDDIIAMARPQLAHFRNNEIVQFFKWCNIRAVFNLQESGEHSFCGAGNLSNGFSYIPEHFMENDIFYYNFPLHDFEAFNASRLLDVVIVMADELTKGKVAVHCHAGHGRTGMVIAACLMLIQGISPEKAVHLVRQKRANSVQSPTQVRALHKFHRLLRKNTSILPDLPFSSTSLYMEFTNRVLPRLDARRYGKIPKPIFLGFVAILHKFFSSVNLTLEAVNENPCRFYFVCNEPTSFVVTEDLLHQVDLDLVIRGQEFYINCVQKGMNITNLESYLMRDVDLVDILSFMDYFIRTAFLKMTNAQEVLLFLASIESNSTVILEDWSWSLCFILSAICCVPKCMYWRMATLTAKWFACGDHNVVVSINNWIIKLRNRYREGEDEAK